MTFGDANKRGGTNDLEETGGAICPAGMLRRVRRVRLVGRADGDRRQGRRHATASPAATSNTGENNAEFFDQATMDKQLAQRSATPEGPADQPWEQMIEPEMRDTAEFKSDKSSGWNVCFSNAGNNNPWRQNGLKTMEAEAKTTKRDREVHGRRRRGQRRQADLRPRVADLGRQVRRPDRRAEHHGDADAGRREGLRERRPGHRVRPWRHHRLPGHVRRPDRRLRLRC